MSGPGNCLFINYKTNYKAHSYIPVTIDVSIINHHEIGLMFTNLDTVWGAKFAGGSKLLSSHVGKSFGMSSGISAGKHRNCRKLQRGAWFPVCSVGTYSFDPSHMLLFHGGETENYAVT